MFRKLFFITSFVLVLALSGSVWAASIDVNNPSFEWGTDGNRVPGHAGIGSVLAWEENGDDPLGQMGFAGADVMCPYASSSHCHRWPGPTDPCGTGADVVYVYLEHDSGTNCYQILDMNNSDANAVIQEGRRYTLRWDAILEDPGDAGNQVRGSLFYVLDPCAPDVNHVELAGKTYSVSWTERPLGACKGTSSLDPTSQCPDWNYNLRVDFVAPAGYDGNTLGIKLASVGNITDAYMFVDNVRLDWQWATQAFNPNPDDGAVEVDKDANLSWSPGLWAKDVNGHDVYFGSTWAEVNSATTASSEFKGVRSPNEYDPGTLILGETYYWRIDEVNENYTQPPGPVPPPPGGKWKGEVWSFTVAGRAKNPYPPDASTDVPKNVILRWTRGVESKYHDIFFGSTEAEVTTATTSSGEYKGRTNLGTELYDAGNNENPTVGEQYFWRIDEVNAITVKGNIWDFTVADYILVDDFDFYANHNAMRTVWQDSLKGLAGNGVVWLNKDANFAVGDSNSMMFEYWNESNPKYSETTRTYATAQDWTYSGNKVTELEIDWIGDINNGDDPPLYVKLSDGSTTAQINPSPNNVAEEIMHTWHIALKDFNDGGVDLSSITKITIGIGDGSGNAKVTEEGTLYFDDIRLQPPRCYPDEGPAGDFTDDCMVDTSDLRLFVADWCKSGGWYPASMPSTTPVVEYLFEEGSGTTVDNTGSLGSSHDLFFGDTFVPSTMDPCFSPNSVPIWSDDADPCRGWTLWFDGEAGWKGDPAQNRKGADYLIIPALNLNSNTVTIASWIKPDPCNYDAKSGTYSQNESFTGLVHWRRKTPETAAGMSYGSGSGFSYDGSFGYVWNDNSSATWNFETDIFIPDFQWSFAAVVIEPDGATMWFKDANNPADPNDDVLRSATNAIAHLTEEFDHWTVIAGDGGLNALRFFRGYMDAVRIYDVSLSPGDILGLAEMEGIVYVPLTSVADLCVGIKDPCDPCAPVDDQIDFCDYAKFADEWLETKLWPLP